MDLTEPVAAALLVRMRHTPASVTGYAVPGYIEHRVCKCSCGTLILIEEFIIS